MSEKPVKSVTGLDGAVAALRRHLLGKGNIFKYGSDYKAMERCWPTSGRPCGSHHLSLYPVPRKAGRGMPFCRHRFRRRLRVNQEIRLRRSFRKLPCAGSLCCHGFFERRWVVRGDVLADADVPVQGERHDQEQAIRAIRGA